MLFQNHPAIPKYQRDLADLIARGYVTEEQTRVAFGGLLKTICDERDLCFVPEFRVGPREKRKIDGAIEDQYSPLGYWEAKDAKDDLEKEIKFKRSLGYPTSNTIFEDTRRAILWQNEREVARFDLSNAEQIAQLLERFFEHTQADARGFAEAVELFMGKIPQLAGALDKKIVAERGKPKFKKAFDGFFLVCQNALNPKIKESAVEEMLVQHLLTERLFKKVFDNEKWFQNNIIASELETVIAALASDNWNPSDFLKSLDPFFLKIEDRARTLPDYGAKQEFLNSVYEQFLKVYSPDTADTMGIVYTPQPIVDWMCASVEHVLETEWNLKLADEKVQILDPCTGTGNFIVNLMRRIPKPDLPAKYIGRRVDENGKPIPELWANEIMLLPYYVASGNIEHEYFDLVDEHAAFEGLCFQDTLDLSPSKQLGIFAEKNTERVARQRAAELMVIIGNPPYNVGQKNENDNNKNRSYKGKKNEPGVDDLIKASYAKASNATLQNKLYDAYVRFIKWAEDRLGDRDGVICFVTNNSFVHKNVFDGMRLTLSKAFDHVWHVDLGGDARSKDKGGNVFGIMVGVGITVLVRNKSSNGRFIRYYRLPDSFNASEKLEWLAKVGDIGGVEWQTLTPNKKNAWLTEGLEADFETFVPLGTKAARASFSADSKTIFKTYSAGVSTNRDAWVYNFDRSGLEADIQKFIEFYNSEVERWKRDAKKDTNLDDFLKYDEAQIKWSRNLKRDLRMGKVADFDASKIREALYRPFSKRFIYFSDILVDERGAWPRLSPAAETKNPVIVISDIGHRTSFSALMTDCIPDLHLCSTSDGFQCFPLYTFSADGQTRFDNITGFALEAARAQWGESVSREDIFYATYALLHAPDYRAKFVENLKRELPRLPLDALPLDAEGWRQLVEIGRKLGDLHVGYEKAALAPLPLREIKVAGEKYNLRVHKMSWNKDKTLLRVNATNEMSGFTPAMFEYRLGNRIALDWVVESYQVKTNDRSQLVSDPNRAGEPRFIVDLIARVATVSLETQKLVGELPALFGE